jgi:hypothetical protein
MNARFSFLRFAGRAAFFLGPLAAPLLFAGDANPATNPAVNWVLPLFTDADGFRSMTLRGSTVKPGPGGGIAVTDLNITVFSGDAAARVETVLLSHAAMFYPKESRAAGTDGVRAIRDEIEVTGQDWTYEHSGKKVSIRKNVRVVYQASLKLPL